MKVEEKDFELEENTQAQIEERHIDADLNLHEFIDIIRDTNDEVLLKEKFRITTEKKISGDVCPDHYAALEIPKIVEKHKDKDIIIIETAGLCLRCSPYIKEGLAINILNILSGHPSSYGPLLTHADVIVVSKAVSYTHLTLPTN